LVGTFELFFSIEEFRLFLGEGEKVSCRSASLGNLSNVRNDRFGIKALHMGPKTIGYEMQQRTNANQQQTYQQVTHNPGSHGIIGSNFTEEEKLERWVEYERSLEASKILDVFRDPNSWRDLQKNPPASANTSVGDMDDSQDPPCPRFNEIRKYLIDNRGVLAFETMHFVMGEHVLLSHIVRYDKIKIQPEELRAFLKMCDKNRDLFRKSH
jgi:hypothetical protein